ncbi:MAG TPA: hypothetical protein VK906_11435 [Egicoccus sp.]|nr:hypothetical protein [Egicoccus sp.]HSK23784.1 hypothetical protein [Egicoccus sp.]
MSLLHPARTADGLTHRQREVLDALEHFYDRHGYAPTLRELADALDLASPSTVLTHIRELERHGKIVREAGLSRTTLPSTP